MSTDAFERWLNRLLAWLDEALLSVAGASGRLPMNRADPDFNRMALDLFALQFERVQPYRRYCEHLGRTPGGVSDWAAIPCIPAVGFKEFDLTSVPAGERERVFRSSGTTRQGASRQYHSKASLELYERSLLPWFARHLLPEGRPMRILSLIPSAGEAPHSSLAHMATAVVRHFGERSSITAGCVGPEGIWELDLDALLSGLESACAAAEPVLLVGTAFSWVHLLEALGQRRLRFALPPGSRLMETGGYKGRSRALSQTELYGALIRTLGLAPTHIVSEYGMSELSSQAYDRTVGDAALRRFRFPPWCAARVVSPETGGDTAPGATGLLQVIDLANAYSVLAVQTEDLAVVREGGFELAGRARSAETRGCSLMHA